MSVGVSVVIARGYGPPVTGFYHDPPIFLGGSPIDHTSGTVFFDRTSLGCA